MTNDTIGVRRKSVRLKNSLVTQVILGDYGKGTKIIHLLTAVIVSLIPSFFNYTESTRERFIKQSRRKDHRLFYDVHAVNAIAVGKNFY